VVLVLTCTELFEMDATVVEYEHPKIEFNRRNRIVTEERDSTASTTVEGHFIATGFYHFDLEDP